MRIDARRALGVFAVAFMGIAACAAPGQPATTSTGGQPSASQPGRIKTLTLPIETDVAAMSVMGNDSTGGGWGGITEIHSAGLITSEAKSTAFVGRLAERVPSVDDGSVSVLPDGRMRVVYNLRKGVTWHDGTPFTAQDLVFTFKFLSDPGIPTGLRDTGKLMSTVEATDDYTAAIYFQSGYYLGNALVLRKFWPQPRHMLEPAYERYLASKRSDEVANHLYWTSEYVHLGPYRMTTFTPGETLEFRAYDGYFLGRPKVDVVIVRAFANDNIVLANLLAGAADLFADGALSEQAAFQLKDIWEGSGAGVVHLRPGGTRTLYPQMRPNVQKEPANLDPRVRGALYMAIDRDSLANERGDKGEGAFSLLPRADRLYEATRDGLRRYSYDPARARSALSDLGWAPGSDGIMRNSADGRKFQTQISITAGSNHWEMPVYADYWRRIGLEVEEIEIPAPQQRNNEFRALYPGWEPSSNGNGDGILGRLQGPAAGPDNRWVGNRGGYDDPTSQALVNRYFASISERDQLQAMKAISDFVVENLPIMPMYYSTDHVGRRTGVTAFDDTAGGMSTGNTYGTYTRNAHLWDVD